MEWDDTLLTDAGVTYSVIVKTSLTNAMWSPRIEGIESDGDGTTARSVPVETDSEFFRLKSD